MVICAGEILADMIGREENGTPAYEMYAGGAPFNVACGLKKLGARCGFYGCVGEDIVGDFLAGFAARQQFDYLQIRREAGRNTTLAFVELSAAGERKFSFFRKHTADHCLSVAAAEKIAALADIVHIGSLPLSEETGRAFADALIAAAHAKGRRISFDVNYRADIFSGEAEAVRVLAEYIARADIVKVSEDELPLFTGGKTGEEGLSMLAGKDKDKTVFLTLGAAGSMACAEGEICRAPSFASEAVDTTGCGDAFFAGALAALDEGETDLYRILRQGNACGACTAARKGAYPQWRREDIAACLRAARNTNQSPE